MTWGQEHATFLEIDQNYCGLTYGVAPCTAALGVTGTKKCFNTPATCQDIPNYLPGVKPLRFAYPQEGILQYGPLIPSLQGVTTTPASLNLGAMGESTSALGRREVVTCKLQDHKYSDLLTDKYRLERSIAAPPPHSGTAQAGTSTTLTLDTGASEEDDEYNGFLLRLTAGPGSVQDRGVTNYVGATRIATVDTRWSTNRFINTHDPGGASWTRTLATVTASAIVANTTDGPMVMHELVETVTTGFHLFDQQKTKAAASRNYVFSVKVKSAERTACRLFVRDGALTVGVLANFNLAAGTSSAGTPSAGWALLGRGMTSLGDGVYQCWIAVSTDSGTTVRGCLYHYLVATNTSNYLGVSGNGIYFAEPQLEEGYTTLAPYISNPSATEVALPDATTDFEIITGQVIIPSGGGYEGFGGSSTTGGEGQPVVHVTSLSNTGAGTFREAVSAGNRRVVFDVGGTITLASDVPVTGGNITIDGLSAPSPGITLTNFTLKMEVGVCTGNVIVRGIRSRNAADDGFRIYGNVANFVIDHCSMQGFGDGAIDVTEGAHDVTIQWCIMGEGDPAHNFPTLIGAGAYRISLHHNLYFVAEYRQPHIGRYPVGDGRYTLTMDPNVTGDVRNNLVWDYGPGWGMSFVDACQANCINNYFYTSQGVTAANSIRVTNTSGDPGYVYTIGNFSQNGHVLNNHGNLTTPCDVTIPATTDAITAAHQVVAQAGARGTSWGLDSVDQDMVDAITTLEPLPPGSGGGVIAGGLIGEPYAPYEQGTFWGKFLARNPYHKFSCRVIRGAVGQALEDMRTRYYVVDRIDGPTNGVVTVVAKDEFSRIEAKKAVAPLASNGYLTADITDVATAATLLPAGVGNLEYPASGHVRIGKEVAAFTRSGDVLTLTRAQMNTEAEEHDQQDTVQLVLSYVTELAHDIVYDLLVTYTTVDPGDIDKPVWDIAAEGLTELLTGHITEPTPVADLIGELEEQMAFTVWPDVETGMTEFVALRAASATTLVDDNEWIIEKSLTLKRQNEKRVSQVIVHYAQVNPVESLDETKNYRTSVKVVDLAAEDPDLGYGQPAIKEIFSRWLPQFSRAFAIACGERILAMFRDPPLEAQFSIVAERDGQIRLARPFLLETAEVQDDTGAPLRTVQIAFEIERDEAELTLRSQQVKYPESDPGGPRTIFIENDAFNINLRTIYSTLYSVVEEEITFIISAGVRIGSGAVEIPALDSGDWPAPVVLTLEVRGRVEGHGGGGGTAGGGLGPGTTGQVGGDALLIRRATSIDNATGQIWGGGGGGGGGGAGEDQGNWYGGGGGGGGAGINGGPAGSVGVQTFYGHAGGPGSSDAGGYGGGGGVSNAHGGAGGAPGVAGSVGSATPFAFNSYQPPGAGGAAGNYASGLAFVTFITVGDVRGNAV